MLSPIKLAKLNDIPLPENYVRDFEKMFEFNLYAIKPNGALPCFNDSDPGIKSKIDTKHNILDILQTGAELFNRKDMLYLATDGKEGETPKFTSYAFHYAGIFIMRSSWDIDARYLAFDTGPFGTGHQHEDKLGFELCAYDRTFIVDPGRYSYAASPYRSFVLSTPAHSTIMVDGQSQNRRMLKHTFRVDKPLPNTWITSPSADYVEGFYNEGYGKDNFLKVSHYRKILFIKPNYWFILDRVDEQIPLSPPLSKEDKGGFGAQQEHKIESMLHFTPGKFVVNQENDEIRSEDSDKANILVKIISDKKIEITKIEGQDNPVQGWIALGYNHKVSAPTIIFTTTTTLPLGLGYILFPYPQGKSIDLEVVNIDIYENQHKLKLSDAVACKIKFGDTVDDLFMLNSVSSSITKSWENYTSNGQVVCIRKKAGVLNQIVLLNGSVLKIGKDLVLETDCPTTLCEIVYLDNTIKIFCQKQIVGKIFAMNKPRVYVNNILINTPIKRFNFLVFNTTDNISFE